MKYSVQFMILGFFVSVLSGCGDPALDMSSDESMRASVQEIMDDLSAVDQENFQATLTGVYLLGTIAAMNEDLTKEEIRQKINAQLDGKTAEDIFDLAEELQDQLNHNAQ